MFSGCRGARRGGASRWPAYRSRQPGRLRVARCQVEEESLEPNTKLEAVDTVLSAKLVFDDDGKPDVRYLAKWKEDGGMTWEPSDNLSEDLIRDFEEAFWQACKAGKMEIIEPALQYGGETMANLVDGEQRSPLHFAAALNQKDLTAKLLAAGADVDATDKEGYTPLHMAAGYLHNDACTALLAAGADITKKDRQGRDISGLLDNLRSQMSSAALLQQRMRLEEVSKALTYFNFEDVAPTAILGTRSVEGERQYLVQWPDDVDDEWLPASLISSDVVEDYERGLEYAEAVALKQVRRRGCSKEYLVQWADGAVDSWESEDNLPRALVSNFERAAKKAKAKEPADKALQPA